MAKYSISTQVHNNIVALISLSIAIIALLYNTWRNEHTERNRNIRPAAFEILNQLGQLQLLVNNIRYTTDPRNMTNPLVGWGHVSFANDLGQLLPRPIPAKMDELVHVWSDNWKQIRSSEVSADKVTEEIDSSRAIVLEELKNLK